MFEDEMPDTKYSVPTMFENYLQGAPKIAYDPVTLTVISLDGFEEEPENYSIPKVVMFGDCNPEPEETLSELEIETMMSLLE